MNCSYRDEVQCINLCIYEEACIVLENLLGCFYAVLFLTCSQRANETWKGVGKETNSKSHNCFQDSVLSEVHFLKGSIWVCYSHLWRNSERWQKSNTIFTFLSCHFTSPFKCTDCWPMKECRDAVYLLSLIQRNAVSFLPHWTAEDEEISVLWMVILSVCDLGMFCCTVSESASTAFSLNYLYITLSIRRRRRRKKKEAFC